jgi:voltage-gated sodium channel
MRNLGDKLIDAATLLHDSLEVARNLEDRVVALGAENQRLRNLQEGGRRPSDLTIPSVRFSDECPSGRTRGAGYDVKQRWKSVKDPGPAPSSSMAVNVNMSAGGRAGNGTSIKYARNSKAPTRGAQLFVNEEDMKKRVRDIVKKGQEGVTGLYHEKGVWGYLARNRYFDLSTTIHIFLNSVWLWIDSDYSEADSVKDKSLPFQIVEHYFCLYFLLEVFVRFMAFKKKSYCKRDAWFPFDSAIAIFMVIDTWIMPYCLPTGSEILGSASLMKMIRLLRLARVLRLAKTFYAMPELMVLLQGMAIATRGAMYSLCLLLGVVYVFALVLRQLTKGFDIEGRRFSTIPHSMSTLLVSATMPDLDVLVMDLYNSNWANGIMFFCFIFVTTFVIMNMLIGILVEIVSVTSKVERDRSNMSRLHEDLEHTLKMADGDIDITDGISKAEFLTLIQKPQCVEAIQRAGVDATSLVDYADVVFDNRGRNEISFIDLVDFILQLRGGNPCTVKDFVNMRKVLLQKFDRMEIYLISTLTAMGFDLVGPEGIIGADPFFSDDQGTSSVQDTSNATKGEGERIESQLISHDYVSKPPASYDVE